MGLLPGSVLGTCFDGPYTDILTLLMSIICMATVRYQSKEYLGYSFSPFCCSRHVLQIVSVDTLVDDGFCGSWRVLATLWLAVPAVSLTCGIVLGYCLSDVCFTDGDAF